MTGKREPGRSDATEAARRARLEREAAALRANLHRRKAQARAAAAPDNDQPTEADPAPRPG